MKGLDNFFQFKQCLGVNISGEDINGMLVELDKKEELEVKSILNSEREILDVLQGNQFLPIAIYIDSNQVIYSTGKDLVTNETAAKDFENEVPNVEIDDFFIHFNGHFFGFARKTHIDEILKLLNPYMDQVVFIGLGPVALYPLARSLNVSRKSEYVTLSGYQFDFTEETPQYTLGEYVDLIQDEVTIPSSLVSAFSVCITFFNYSGGSLGYNWQDYNKTELLYRKILSKLKMPVLVGILLLFVTNTILFFYYDNLHGEIMERSNVEQGMIQRVKNLESYVEKNSAVLLLDKNIFFSKISDQLGASVPSGVVLDRLVINPEVEGGREKKYDKSQVVLSGRTRKLANLSGWIAEIRDMDWVSGIASQKVFKVPNSKGIHEFEIVINRNVKSL